MADWFLYATQPDVISIGVRLVLQAAMIVERFIVQCPDSTGFRVQLTKKILLVVMQPVASNMLNTKTHGVRWGYVWFHHDDYNLIMHAFPVCKILIFTHYISRLS